jgi:hypothetical protein
MNDTDQFFTYSFTGIETKLLSVMLQKQGVPLELKRFSKALSTALLRNISLEEAERLFHE